MKGLKKKLSLVLASCMVFSLAGCGDKKKKSSDDDFVNYVYAKDDSFADVSNGKKLVWYDMIGDNLYYCVDNENDYQELQEAAMDATEGDASINDAVQESKVKYEFYKSDLNGGNAESLGEFETKSGMHFVSTFLTSPNGTVYFYDQDYDGDESKNTLYKIENGKCTEVGDFTHVCQSETSYLSGFFAMDDGTFVAVYGDNIKRFDEDLKQISELPQENYIDGSALDKDNNIVVKTLKESTDPDSTDTTVLLSVYDIGKNSLGTAHEVDINGYSAYQFTKGFGDYDIIIRTAGSLYGYKYSDGSREKLVDFYGSNIYGDGASRSMFKDKDAFYFQYEVDDEPQKLVKYKKVDPKDVEDRVVLTLAITGESSNVKKLVRKFNESQSKYTVQIIDYTEENNPNSKLGADISAGKVPDIYIVESGIANQPIQQYVSKGMLEDLEPYIEKDPDMSMSDFIPSVMDSLRVDGKLYSITSHVSLNTLIGDGAEVGDDSGWTAKQFREYIESQPEGAMIFEGTTKDSVLYNIMLGCGNQFVDWEKGECYFDSEDFKNILQICGEFPEDEELYSTDNSTADNIKNKKALFIDTIVCPEEIEAANKLFKGKASFKGFPVKEGRGSYFTTSTGFAMSAKCEDKDGAWEFMKTLLSKEYVADEYMYTGLIPVREDVFKMKMDSVTTTKEYKDEFGNVIKPREGMESLFGVEMEAKPFSEDIIKRYRELIDNTSMLNYYNEAVSNIISEEAAAYFNGDKSIDDVCKIIQDRATTFINENK